MQLGPVRCLSLAALFCLAAETVLAQGAVTQSGTAVPGQVPVYIGNRVVKGAGSADGNGIGIGELLQVNSATTPATGPDGTHSCFRDGALGTAHHFLCLDANALGGGLIEFGSAGGASTLPLQFKVNGSLSQYPGTGTGNILGPVSSTVNEFALWNNTTGSLQKDAKDSLIGHSYAFPSSFGSTPTSAVLFQFGTAFPIAGEMPAGTLQGLVSTMTVPNSYSQAPWPPTTFASYIDSQNSANTNSVVGFFGSAYANAPGSGTLGNNVTGFNYVISNTAPANGFSAPSLGKDFGQLVGIEVDFNPWKRPGGVTPAGKIDGVVAILGGEVIPTGGATAFHVVFVPGPPPWTTALLTDNGAASAGIHLGSILSAVSQVSQGIQLDALNNVGAAASGLLQVVPDGATAHFDFRIPTAGSFRTQVNSVTQQDFSSTALSSLPALRVGSLTQALDTNGFGIFHAAANENLEIRGHVTEAAGVAIESLNDALNAALPLELLATTLRVSSTSIIIAGTTAVSCAAGVPNITTLAVVQGIVTHC